jgi:hypothetical protein
MRLISALALAGVLGLSVAAAAQDRPPAPPRVQSSDVSPVESIHGTIVGVNERARLVTVRGDAGQVVTVRWTEFTRLAGDQIRVGNVVWLDMMEQGGREVATAITIQAAKPY